MYRLIHNFSLRDHNTFGISAIAKHYLTVNSHGDLLHFLKENNLSDYENRLFLGGGSNLLFINDFNGIVIHPEIGGIRLVSENKSFVEVEAGAGVNWDYFVEWCVEKGWGGIENLSLIPGNIGAVPVQNIGAYGVEAASAIIEVRGITLDSDSPAESVFNQQECKFGYRTSIFKAQLAGQFIVTSVLFRLSKRPGFQLQYEGLIEKVGQIGGTNLRTVRQAIIEIRKSKLPDPVIVGNAGSFFKNPVVSELIAKSLKNLHPDMPQYPIGSGLVKIAAGWLIEKTGWKGKSAGKAAIHDKQALVIINKGGASGKEIFRLSELVAEDVLRKFNIVLEREVQVVGN